jgi:hypothetical protein
MRQLSILAAFAILSIGIGARAPEIAWPQFRGPSGAGILSAGKLPTSWSSKDNVAWSVEITGRGWSSPVAWNNTVYVTSAISPGAFKAPQTGIFGNDYVAELAKQGLSEDEVVKKVIARDVELTSESGDIRYMIYAFDARAASCDGSARRTRARRSAAVIARTRTHQKRRRPTASASTSILETSGCSRTRWMAVAVDDEVRSAADVSRLRHRRLAGRARRPRLRRARQRRQVLRGGDRREDRQAAVESRSRSAREPDLGWSSPFIWKATMPNAPSSS